MKDALALLLTRLAEWIGYPKTQLKELYAPLDLLMRDATTLFALYPEVLCAPEAAGKTSQRRMRQARVDAGEVMDEAAAINGKMVELIRSKWDLVDRKDVPLFAAFLESQVRLRHSTETALELAPEVVFDAELAERIHTKAEAKRRWPWGWFSRKKAPRGVQLGSVMVYEPLPPKPDARQDQAAG